MVRTVNSPSSVRSPDQGLVRANDVFQGAYDRARENERRDGPVFVVLADDLVVFLPNGTKQTLRITPDIFHTLKAAAHIPVAIFAAVHQKNDEALGNLRSCIERARAATNGPSDPSDDAGAAIREVLEESMQFIDAALAAPAGLAGPDLNAFARASGQRLLHLTALATRVQLDALHDVVEEAVHGLAVGSLDRLEVIVTGNHQARARSLAMQYFGKRFGEPEGADERVTYAEGVESADDALALVGTRRMDARIAEAFFGDSKRLQRDILGDAVRDLLARTELGRLCVTERDSRSSEHARPILLHPGLPSVRGRRARRARFELRVPGSDPWRGSP